MKARFAALFAGLILCADPGKGALLTQTLGDQDFANGDIVGTATFTGANAGDPAPFNQFIGSDVSGPNFSARWTFNSYGPVVLPIVSASLLIASYEFDTTNTSLGHVASFTMNGIDLAAVLNAAFNADPNLASSEIRWYTISLPSTTFTQLASGTATFSLTLQNGRGVLGDTTFNGAGMDFSTLTLDTEAQTAVPEPSTVFGAIGALAAAVLISRRKRAA